MIASFQFRTHPLIVTVFMFHYCLVKTDDWLPLHKLRIGRSLCPFKKCVCLHACGWKSQPWILNLSERSYCSHAKSSLPPCSNKETEETACQTRGSYFSWQVPSLRHSNRVTSSNVVLAAVPNCRWVWIHTFLFSVLLIALGFCAPCLNKLAGTFLFDPCIRVTYNKRAVLCRIEVTRADGKWLVAVVIK